jgi:hypothetical protein
MTSHFISRVGVFVLAGYWVLPENYLVHKSLSMRRCVCCSPLLPWICSYIQKLHLFCLSSYGVFVKFWWSDITIENGALRHVGARVYKDLLRFLNIVWCHGARLNAIPFTPIIKVLSSLCQFARNLQFKSWNVCRFLVLNITYVRSLSQKYPAN